jgi:hypothetical protein
MVGRAFVSRFSPNRTDPEILEAIFVQRHTLAEVWLERLRELADLDRMDLVSLGQLGDRLVLLGGFQGDLRLERRRVPLTDSSHDFPSVKSPSKDNLPSGLKSGVHYTERALSDLFWLLPPSIPGVGFPYLPDLIATIFRTSTDPKVWAHRVAGLVEMGAEAKKDGERTESEESMIPEPETSTGTTAPPGPLAMVGNALVRSLTNKVYAEATAAALDDWASVWQDVAKRHPDLSLAVRLFGVGLRYVRTNDERALLDLVREERSILRELFKLCERDHVSC